MVPLEMKDGAVYLPVKVIPGASATRCRGTLDGRLKVAVAAAPEKGKANAELTAYLAKRLGLRRRDVTVARGRTGAIKLIRIENGDPPAIRHELGLGDAE